MDKTEITMIGLLEILAFRTCCMYLSDLHQPENFPAIQQTLCNILPEQFSPEEWCDAVEYITGERISFESPGQAADYLKKYQMQ